jgi:hypothetical protein
MNQVQLQTMLASKAQRVVTAAAGHPVYDFGARRTHGIDAAVKGARAFHIAGVAGTSNVLAGKEYGLPVVGTMAHSYIQAHADETKAFRSFARCYPGTTLMEDGRAVRDVIARAGEELPGEPLLVPAMRHGERLTAGWVDLQAAREHARQVHPARPTRWRSARRWPGSRSRLRMRSGRFGRSGLKAAFQSRAQ